MKIRKWDVGAGIDAYLDATETYEWEHGKSGSGRLVLRRVVRDEMKRHRVYHARLFAGSPSGFQRLAVFNATPKSAKASKAKRRKTVKRAGMAVRYSGKVKVTLSWHDAKNHYDVRLSAPGERAERIHVGAPAYLTYAVDSPIAYDQAASAALSFSSEDMQEKAQTNRQGTGWDIQRSK